MKENRIVRLKDIAESLGTSINTVSHALKDKSDISVEMKEKVKKKAMELGYFPNIIASSLRNGSSKVIAVVFDHLLNPYYMVMVDLISTKLNNSKYDTFFYRLEKGQFTMDVLFKIFSRKVDGIISFSEPSYEICDFCNRLNMPLVLVGRKNDDLNISCVYTDDIKGGYLACKKMIESGAKNVAYLGAPYSIECSRRRKDGFVQYLKDNNLNINEDNYIFLKEDNESIEKYLELLIDRGVDGIFCFNDMMALDAIRYLNSKNINVPSQVKIIGYDDIYDHFLLPMGLTSIGSNKSLTIDIALELIFDQINDGNNMKKNKKIDVVLHEKNTC